MAEKNKPPVEISVIMPCLNEEKTLGLCIERARRCLEKNNLNGEVIVVDNGSSDRSIEIARNMGVKLVSSPVAGYGITLINGIKQASGRFIVIGDADNTYDFAEMSGFIDHLRQGYNLVVGTRIKGQIIKGAMPWLNRHVGTPVLTGLINLLYGTKFSDSNCGIRAFTKEAFNKMNLETSGMEFASEMLVNAARLKLKIIEIPVTYYPAVKSRQTHLRRFRDGFRHLKIIFLNAIFRQNESGKLD